MPATYEPIATTTLGSAATTITFSSIPSTYTDLRLVFVGTNDSTNILLGIRFNNDSGLNYSITPLSGSGTSASSTRRTSRSSIEPLFEGDMSSTNPIMATMDLFSYTGSTNKTCLTSGSTDYNGSGYVTRTVGLWRNTSAVNRIDIYVASGNLDTGSTATLYGILKA
jgi:hypothetical protein